VAGDLMSGPVVLAGGTGGAKLARGMLDVAGDTLTVNANTGDDIEIYGANVSPDPDLVTYWLADRIDERGWGLSDDTFAVMDGLRELGVEVWFNLGDRDLAVGIERSRRLAEGARLTETLAELCTAFGVTARVLPMCDEPVRTWVQADTDWTPFQEFMIRAGGKAAGGTVRDTELRGVDAALPTPEIRAALATASAIVIGPSNPVISIGPILAIPEMRQAMLDSPAPIVAVSPIVGGDVLKGPTEAFMRWAGFEATSASIAACYDGLIDGLVADEPVGGLRLPVLQTDTLMSDAASRRRVAAETLQFAAGLAA
jgi:LPPG:FO 2-phospho-L-lactate transferase